MCNRLHYGHAKIPKVGKGWKIFQKGINKKNVLFPMSKPGDYTKDPKGWTTWNSRFDGDGFCFFLTREAARKVLSQWKGYFHGSSNQCVVRRIEYEGGLGKFLEDQIIGPKPHLIALCKKFRVVE